MRAWYVSQRDAWFQYEVVAVEVRGERAEGHPRLLVRRLVHRAVQDHAVDPRGERAVAERLQLRGRLAVVGVAGVGLGPEQRLAVAGGGGGRQVVRERADVARTRGARLVLQQPVVVRARPELEHGQVDRLRRAQHVERRVAAAAVDHLGVQLDVALVQQRREPLVVALADQVGDRASEVEEHGLRLARRADLLAGQDRKPGQQAVAATLLELLREAAGPVLEPGLPAVDQDEAERSSRELAGLGDQLFGEAAEVVLDGGGVHLVGLEPGALAGGGAVPGASRRVAEAQHGPRAGGRLPAQPPVAVHALGQQRRRRTLRPRAARRGPLRRLRRRSSP